MIYFRMMALGMIGVTFCFPGHGQDPYQKSGQSTDTGVVGNWTWTMTMGPMKKDLSMKVIEKEGKLVAVVTAPDGNRLESSDFKLTEDRVQFSIRQEQGNGVMIVTHQGRLKRDQILGTIKMTGGPFNLSSKWNASRTE